MEQPLALVDPYGRRIRKLRVSLTDRCNLRCGYCMPVDALFQDPQTHLDPGEYETIVRELLGYGLEEVRLTGGEPLLAPQFGPVAERLGSLPLKKLGLTTNGILLPRWRETLKRVGIRHLNISLDSLDPDTFRGITHRDSLSQVLEGIECVARDPGFVVKLNTVLMKGINDHEVEDLIEYAKALDVEIRFLELMRIGHACGDQSQQFISAQSVIERLGSRYHLQPVSQPLDSTSFNFTTACGARIGFIASESQPFCGHCSRWRLSADGVLRACLLKEDGIPIRHLTPLERAEAYQKLLGMKPYLRPAEVTHAMNQIGG